MREPSTDHRRATDEPLEFVRPALPEPPARVLEVGAGEGELAAALGGLGEPVRGPYLHRRHVPPCLRDAEERLIAEGSLPATGARLVGRLR